MKKSKNVKRAFICTTGFHHHLGEDPHGETMYPTLKKLLEKEPCVEECGAYEIEIRIKKLVRKGKL